MIRINLLPIRAARKRESVKQQLILGVVLLAGAIIGLVFWHTSVASQIEGKKKEIISVKARIKEYEQVIGEIEKYKGQEDRLNKKIAIIAQLNKGKTGPVRVLDRFCQVMPKQVWLTKWEEKSGQVTLQGEALNNKFVAQFISSLKEPNDGLSGKAGQKFFTNVHLVEVAVSKTTKDTQQFVKFKLTMKVNYAI
jgi:type IV pilus assembly protein PilN